MSDPSQPAKAEARTLTSTSSSTPLAIDPPPQKVDKIPEEAPMILDVSGESIPIKLDKLGPMIINSDGVSISQLLHSTFLVPTPTLKPDSRNDGWKQCEALTTCDRQYQGSRIGMNYHRSNKNGRSGCW